MPGDPIDRAYLEIDGDQIYCDSIDIEPEDDSEFVTAMTKDNEPIGVSMGNRRYRIRADITVREDEDVDLHQLWEDKENVPAGVEFESGKTWEFSNGYVSKPGISARHGEKATWSLELLCYGLQIS
jgi:hypothetical protein